MVGKIIHHYETGPPNLVAMMARVTMFSSQTAYSWMACLQKLYAKKLSAMSFDNAVNGSVKLKRSEIYFRRQIRFRLFRIMVYLISLQYNKTGRR